MYRSTRLPEVRSTRSALAFEAHHLLHDGFALLRDVVLLARSIRALFAELLVFSADGHAHELVDFFSTTLADRHGPSPLAHRPESVKGRSAECRPVASFPAFDNLLERCNRASGRRATSSPKSIGSSASSVAAGWVRFFAPSTWCCARPSRSS